MPSTLVITISPIPPDIPKYGRTQWRHWTDQDGNCRNARQETLAAASVVAITLETSKGCRVASGQWRDAHTGLTKDVPDAVDIDHLVPLQAAVKIAYPIGDAGGVVRSRASGSPRA